MIPASIPHLLLPLNHFQTVYRIKYHSPQALFRSLLENELETAFGDPTQARFHYKAIAVGSAVSISTRSPWSQSLSSYEAKPDVSDLHEPHLVAVLPAGRLALRPILDPDLRPVQHLSF